MEFFCSEVCQARWNGQDLAAPLPADWFTRVGPLTPVDLTGVQEAMGRAVRDLAPLMHAVNRLPPETVRAAAAGAVRPGMKSALAHMVEVERLELQVRMVCPPDRLQEVMAEVDRRAGMVARSLAIRSVLDDLAIGRLPASRSAASPQVAPENPQVASNPDPQVRWLARLFGRTT